MSVEKIKKELRSKIKLGKADVLQRFFKTGKGEYGEGDIFMGVMVPDCRIVAKKYKEVSFDTIKSLLKSKIHEERLTALLILVEKTKKEDEKVKKDCFDFYLKNTKYVNNWDLVDLSCRFVVGDFLLDKKRDILYKLAKSKNIWEKRIAIVSTYSLICKNNFKDTLLISKILLKDEHDLIQKAVGWMLREVGKRDFLVLYNFLDKNIKNMSRTTLRYSIEKFDKKMREKYLKYKV